MRSIKEIIIHCSATRSDKDFHASDIERWHKERGFKSIGYHYVIALDGSIEFGRSLSEIGAHCLGHNKKSIGICYIGGLDLNGSPCGTLNYLQRESLIKLLGSLVKTFPGCSIHGHNEFSNKLCPCFDVGLFVDFYYNRIYNQ